MSGKNGIDLFDAIVDDLARALVQQSWYLEFLEKGRIEKGPNKMELLPHATRCQLSTIVFEKFIDRYATKFHDKEPHLEGERHFGGSKSVLKDELSAKK